MDEIAYKDVRTSRGFTYHYYFSLAHDGKPTLIFLHGFPSTSFDWRHQVAFFKKKGYGLIVPDLLGYGGTSKPTNTEAFRMRAMAKDVVEILDAEAVSRAIAVAHDWGTLVASRLANYFPDRFMAFAFIAAPYASPWAGLDAKVMKEYAEAHFGRDIYGYWWFMSEEGADKLIEENWESFRSVIWPVDPAIWKTDLAPTDALKAWLTAGQRTSLPPYITQDEMVHQRDVLLKGGFASPVCWYRAVVDGTQAEDDKAVPAEAYDVHAPVFFAAALKDYICLPETGKPAISQRCKNPGTVIKEYDGDHWILLSHADSLNKDLLSWIESSSVQKVNSLKL